MSIDLVVPENVELTTLLDELRKLSWAAADVLMAYARGQEPPYGFPKSLTIEEGGDGPVSAADMAVNELLISGLKDNFTFQDWDILSEETTKEKTFHRTNYKKDWCWILDPLDGTKDFLQGSENYAVHIALAHKKKPKIGLVLIPERNELWVGIIGSGAWCENRNGFKKDISFSERLDISELVLVSSKNHQQSTLLNLLSTLSFSKTKRIGSVGCKVASILRGESDVYISLSGKTAPKDWDMAAPHALIEAAGGMFSHADGANLIYQKSDYSQSGCLIASHGKSHLNICKKAMKFFSKEEPKFKV
ncbi:3'(2'),5'-bisphosphate nucleotidase CysQ [Prochlorococcus marinus]|uniref:inositol-phosphate phosphatase n=1 Tax=Prochlorococcus marinus XMU1408 TaxID=2213228 RepID=A0A318R2K7_PROMR|nr:3'(2'),5'-bisphosphate nucleotidase CysQ [Prochlorococcus marinus]MBW3042429.1 3'(2'),5'-bisphosphate nucleotidase CysQ [Prochlorococcus marinus str. XMU1408]PYE01161.1 3'(2'),5'-bisphosphate nucleotidase CysQ [Prochlorococcus marinus XMU1408]